jgi:membrane-bound metal-dependent hydrolase YbcI (DUF457 family)
MASYRGHLRFSTSLGIAYGGLAFLHLGDPWTAAVAGGICALGGLLPDLDSDSGVPQRELFTWVPAVIPAMFFRRMHRWGLTHEQVIVLGAVAYAAIRYGVSALFRRITVHRGMFHSIPAMLIAGLVVFLSWHHPNVQVPLVLAGGVMLGFFSHLLLDEIWAVDFRGVVPTLNKYAGTACKFFSPSPVANVTTYAILGGLVVMLVRQTGDPTERRDAAVQVATPAATTTPPTMSLPTVPGIPFVTDPAPQAAPAKPAPAPPPPPPAASPRWAPADESRSRLLTPGR